MTDIITRYQQALSKQELQPDKFQSRAVTILQKSLTQHQQRHSKWQRLFSRFNQRRQGVYLWGDVGRGKTMLMNMFYASLETPKKQRWHFQEFMQFVHQQLHRLQGQADPLASIVNTLAEEIEVLCLDELLVEDIADAMLLAGLLPALLAKEILFVTTGNLAPVDLYKNGWQRERFLPTIHYLQKHLYVVHLNNPHDYRRQTLISTDAEQNYYIYPDDQAAEDYLQAAFERFATPPIEEALTLDINQHLLTARKCSADALWCTFDEMCMHPRNSQDYLKLCSRFPTILISHVPRLDENQENAARRFMSLVDVCYDRRIRLILSAAVPIHELYHGKLLQHAFQRTLSRLWEMQVEFQK
jgi:cell division protein ZapE